MHCNRFSLPPHTTSFQRLTDHSIPIPIPSFIMCCDRLMSRDHPLFGVWNHMVLCKFQVLRIRRRRRNLLLVTGTVAGVPVDHIWIEAKNETLQQLSINDTFHVTARVKVYETHGMWKFGVGAPFLTPLIQRQQQQKPLQSKKASKRFDPYFERDEWKRRKLHVT